MDTPHEKHRQRMFERLQKNGIESLQEHEVLEILLYYAVPRRDTNEIAHRLLQRFGTLHAVLDAPPEALCEVAGVGPRIGMLIGLTHGLMRRYQMSREQERQNAVRYTTREKIGEYFLPQFEGLPNERLLVAYLDNSLRVIRCEINNEGAPGAVRFDFRKLMQGVFSFHASAVMLAHNHPQGDVVPSAQDLALTDQIEQSLRDIGCRLVDHVIVADGRYASLMALRIGIPKRRQGGY